MRKLAFLMILLICGSAAAQQQPRQEKYVFFQNGSPIGEETARFFEFGDTLLIDSYTRINVPEPREHRARTVVMAPEDIFHDYLYWVASGDTVRAWNTGSDICTWRITKKQPGDSCIALGGRKGMVMESGVAHHLWLLARQFNRDPSGRQDLRILVPQGMFTSNIERESVSSQRAELNGMPISIQRYAFSAAGLYQELDTDAEGNFLRLNLPIRNFQVLRQGYDPKSVAAASLTQPEEELSIDGGGPSLPGTLTLPAEGTGPHPAVVFLHDSGQVDRDLSIGANKIFQQLAQGLAERGIASLRYDKRTLVIEREAEEAISGYGRDISLNEAVLDDANAAYELLANDSRLRSDGLFILGHGLGGAAAATVALRLESEGEQPAGLVMLAPIGRDLLSVYMEMYRFLADKGLARESLLTEHEGQIEKYNAGNVGEDNRILFATPRYWDSVIFWKPWQDYAEQSAPALILFGERDFVVRESDRETWAGQFADNPRAGSRLYLEPDLNHVFLPGSGPIGPEEYGKPNHLKSETLDKIAAWVKEQLP